MSETARLRQRARPAVAASAVLGILALAGAASAKKEPVTFPLEGKSVQITLKAGLRTEERGRSEDVLETLTFDNGTLRFSELAKLGVPDSPYTVERKNDTYWIIEVKQKDDTGELKVDADVRKTWFSGAIIWKKKGGKDVNWLFHDEVLKKKKE